MKTDETYFYALSAEETLAKLKTDSKTGLSSGEAEKRLHQYGQNGFEKGGRVTLLNTLLPQVKNPLVSILFAALCATLVLGEFLDAIVITIALLINIIIGVVQEGRAHRAFEKLQDSQVKHASVTRDGEQMIIPAEALVPGDIVTIHAGSSVSADIRLLESNEIKINESALTGESRAVHKTPDRLTGEKEITEQANTLFMGTLVLAGHGAGIVIRTGNTTEIGKIAESLADIENTVTPIQKSLKTLADLLAKAVIAVVAFVFLLGLLQGREMHETLLISIAIAVSILPEGLPASVTVVLAIGVEKILRRGGLVKNLLAAETLGSTTVILTDKTGTLTQSKMNISDLVTLDTLEMSGVNVPLSKSEEKLLVTSLYTTDAFITEEGGEKKVNGRPIEKALLEAGIDHRLAEGALSSEYERIDLLSFESKNKFSASLNQSPDGVMLHVSGAPELMIESAQFVLTGNTDVPSVEEAKRSFYRAIETKSAEGRRFIGIASKKYSEEEFNEAVRNDVSKLLEGLTFAGLIGFEDPIREDVPEAVRIAKEAGATVIMVTGDLAGTAKSIALQAGIATRESTVMLGKETEGLTDEELLQVLKETRVFSRVLPQQKLRISRVLQENGEIVAMTGDGINDAPALHGASIGIAVESGTEVAKAASDMILLGNSFSIIIAAIEEGRRIISNLKKIVAYLLSTNLGECIAIVGSLILALPVPLLPAQILWVNIIGEGLLNFALAFEPSEQGGMKRSPEKIRVGGVITRDVRHFILVVGSTTGFMLLLLYGLLLRSGMALEDVRTIMFITLTLGTTLYAFSFKSFTRSIFRTSIASNSYLLISALVNVGLLYISISAPVLRNLLSLSTPSISLVTIAVGASLFNLLVIEVSKMFASHTRS